MWASEQTPAFSTMKIPIKRVAIAILALLVLLVLAGVPLIVLMVVFEYPGGMRGSYPATDHDRRLTAIAREAAPIIQWIDRYHNAHGRCPRPSESDLAEANGGLPLGLTATFHNGENEFREAKAITGWWYSATENDLTACELWRKLGWDPALIWRRRGGETKWIFDAGDGREEKTIDLDVGG